MRKFKNFLIIFLCLAVFFGLAAFSLLSKRIPKNPPGTVGNTAGNLNNGGLFCEDGEKVYFANAYDNGTLYCMNADETGVVKISDAQVRSINAGGKYLYYYQSSSAASESFASMFRIDGVYRAKKDGTSAICLKRVPAPSLSLAGSTVFYQSYSTKTGTSLRRIGIDKTDDAEIADVIINPAGVQNGLIYFGGTGRDHYLYTLNTETNAISTVFEGNVYNPQPQGDFIYYMDISDDYKLCRYRLSDGSIQTLTQDRLDFFNVVSDMIYYQKSDAEQPALKRIRTDGSGEEVVASGVYENINATSRYVYFNAYGASVPVYHTPVNGPVQVSFFRPAP